MAEEQIPIKLSVGDDFFQDLERRFEASVRKASQGIGQSLRGAGAGGSGLSGQTPGGGGGGMAGEISKALGGSGLGAAGGALFDVGAATLQGAQQGIRSVRGDATGSSRVMADAAITGGASSFVESTVGKIPILGDILVAQMNAAKDAIEVPRERATAQVQQQLGGLVRGGYEVSDEELKASLDFSNEIQQRGYKFEQRVNTMNREAHPTSAAFGLNWAGSG